MTGVLISFELASMVLLSWVFLRGFEIGPALSMRAHIISALAATAFCVFSHSLTMMYMAAIGRMIRQAVEQGNLTFQYVLDATANRKKVFRVAAIAMLVVMLQTILGGGAHTKALPVWIHFVLAIITLLVNLYAVYVEIRCLIVNHMIGHRAAREFESRR